MIYGMASDHLPRFASSGAPLLLLFSLTSCGNVAGDNSSDAAVVDAGVDTAKPACSPSREGAACVPTGSYVMSRWSTGAWDPASGGWNGFPEQPKQTVTLDGYSIDIAEVTNIAFFKFTEETGASPPPERCGRTIVITDDTGSKNLPEISGWAGGKPSPDRLDHPVVCVTRGEAMAFCAARGGRLPTIAEWMSAGRPQAPAAPPYTWGATPPRVGGDPTDNAPLFEYLVFANSGWIDLTALVTKPVTSGAQGKSAWGVVGLAGNASEWLETCAEDIDAKYPKDAPTIANPTAANKKSCTDRTLRAGSNWRSFHTYGAAALAIYDFRGRYLASPSGDSDWEMAVNAPEASEGGTDDPTGNTFRSWYVGFRCAYPK